MLTNEQIIFVIRTIYPQITEYDHGQKYWVGTPMDGDTPLDHAFIAQWDFDDLEQPTQEAILTKWADPTVQAAFAEANQEPPRTQFSVREFRARFTQDEQIAIRSASMTDMEVGIVYDDFQASSFIDLNDPAVAAGVDLYIAKGLLDEARRDVLLAPEPAV
ncbi:hypothetical protein LQZ44_11915 [Alcaligenes nematophilus]|uniref:hypothetical protein n=1 Tax=Alcaligenes nematophilus TaxID=2994643 RepID=UPI0035B56935